jgi:hypothetical protein
MALNVNGLTAAIEAGFEREWQAAKGTPAPSAGQADRRIMFAAVARGVLQYLEDHQNELLRTITARQQGGESVAYTVVAADLGIDAG